MPGRGGRITIAGMPLKYGLLEPIDVSMPQLPPELEGLRVAHITDLHAQRITGRLQRLAGQLSRHRVDLACYTGDYMTRKGDEPAALEALSLLADQLKPTLGSFGVFGNHDSPALIQQVQDLPIHWLSNASKRVTHQGCALEILGLSCTRAVQSDAAALALDAATPMDDDEGGRPMRLMLSHFPDLLPHASDLGADLVLSGHTHGGQCRLPTGHAIRNSSGLPLHLSSGILRHRDTLALVSRGIGQVGVPFRVFCPPHAPIYTLRRRSAPGAYSPSIRLIEPW